MREDRRGGKPSVCPFLDQKKKKSKSKNIQNITTKNISDV
jgi:hypothetical protein